MTSTDKNYPQRSYFKLNYLPFNQSFFFLKITAAVPASASTDAGIAAPATPVWGLLPDVLAFELVEPVEPVELFELLVLDVFDEDDDELLELLFAFVVVVVSEDASSVVVVVSAEVFSIAVSKGLL